MKCSRCEKDITVGSEVDGKTVCLTCFNPFRRCRKCGRGQLYSAPTPNWMNRWKCDQCKKCMSR
jgi:hypothetical protein